MTIICTLNDYRNNGLYFIESEIGDEHKIKQIQMELAIEHENYDVNLWKNYAKTDGGLLTGILCTLLEVFFILLIDLLIQIQLEKSYGLC